jgi:hypothetical protein
MKQVDLDGTVFLLDDDNGRYRYKLFENEYGWKVLLRDDGYRIYSIYVGDKPTNEPFGQREWELMWEYKHCDAPGHQAMVELIMEGFIPKKEIKANED